MLLILTRTLIRNKEGQKSKKGGEERCEKKRPLGKAIALVLVVK